MALTFRFKDWSRLGSAGTFHDIVAGLEASDPTRGLRKMMTGLEVADPTREMRKTMAGFEAADPPRSYESR